jgi:RNA polymerase sigma-70 factor (ECF subfamily)
MTMSEGASSAASQLLPLVYEELHALARHYFRRQGPDHTLQPTALVHEAYLKMIDQTGATWNDRAHFVAVAATAMRQILINHVVRKRTAKRGGGRRPSELNEADAPVLPLDENLLALHEELNELARLDERKARLVEMRFFGGLTHEEIGVVLDVSPATVDREWRTARAWLAARLSEGTPPARTRGARAEG